MHLPRLPWKVQNAARVARAMAHYYRATCFRRRPAVKQGAPTVGFVLGWHGRSGGTNAVAGIANCIAEHANAVVVGEARSELVPQLAREVRVVAALPSTVDIVICDCLLDAAAWDTVRGSGALIVPTMHGFLRDDPRYESLVRAAMRDADYTHFVDSAQIEEQATVAPPPRPFVIGNAVAQVPRRERGCNGALGVVGNMTESRKNLPGVLAAYEQCAASELHIWGNVHEIKSTKPVVVHGWSNSKPAIYHSFDVLLMPSLSETFGLAVAEALSAGLLCVISDIPAFDRYRDCPGVFRADPRNPGAIAAAANAALELGDARKADIIAFWRAHFSPQVMSQQWRAAIEGMLTERDPSAWGIGVDLDRSLSPLTAYM